MPNKNSTIARTRLEKLNFLATTQGDHTLTEQAITQFRHDRISDQRPVQDMYRVAAVQVLDVQWAALQRRISSMAAEHGFSGSEPGWVKLHQDVTDFAELVSDYAAQEGWAKL